MLDLTLTTKFVVGTNVKGDLASADWRFLLPRLQFGQALCLGVPQAAAVRVLAKVCQRLFVISTNHQRLRRVVAESKRRGLTNVKTAVHDDLAALPYLDGSFDLIFVTRDGRLRKLLGDKKIFEEARRLLKADGVVYFELRSLIERLLSRKTLASFPEFGLSHPQILRLTPSSGELLTAIPVHDQTTADYFQRHLTYTASRRERLFQGLDRLLGNYRRGVITQRLPQVCNGHLPHYLTSLATEVGARLDDYGWGMSATGRYNSKKVLFYFLDQKSGEAEAVIKLTRNPVFNARLENEHRTLSRLRERNLVAPETIPQPWFFGYRGNLAIVGQKVVRGRPFRQATRATIDCPLANAAMGWIADLGAASAEATGASPTQVAEAMTSLFRQYSDIYKPSSNEHTFIEKQIDNLAQNAGGFRTVFQHGDSGIWNVLATGAESIAFLDWEAAEPQGMPLWDLFYFLRSYGRWMSRVRGERDSLKSFSQNFLMPSPLSDLLARLAHRYCERVQINQRLLEPLFYTCWMHRALKEATRLTQARLEKGHYVNLLRLCIESRNAPALARLFSETSSKV